MQKELTQCNYLYSKAYVELTLIMYEPQKTTVSLFSFSLCKSKQRI